MDKLRPILKQKYWICFGLALIFVLYGWWVASDGVGRENRRTKEVR